MIEEALLQIREDMARLTAKMRERGHNLAAADFRIEKDGRFTIWLDTRPDGVGERAFVEPHGFTSAYVFARGNSYRDIFALAEAFVAGMKPSEALACSAWFEPVAEKADRAADRAHLLTESISER